MNHVSVPNRKKTPDMNKLVKVYGDSLLRMCFLYLKDLHMAEDAVQDTFLKVYKSYMNFKGDCEEKTWITRISINVCKNYLRSSWWKRIDEAAVLENITVGNSTDTLQDEALLLEIMKLSPKYKEVILLFYYQSMKIREIAMILNIPENTVSVRLLRAREILKKKLKGWYYDE